jgi:hypothetical protein
MMDACRQRSAREWRSASRSPWPAVRLHDVIELPFFSHAEIVDVNRMYGSQARSVLCLPLEAPQDRLSSAEFEGALEDGKRERRLRGREGVARQEIAAPELASHTPFPPPWAVRLRPRRR